MRRTIVVLMALMIFALGAAAHAAYAFFADRASPAARLNEVWRLARDHYDGPVDGALLWRGAADGLLGTLDPYCEYYSPDDWNVEQPEIKGKFGGIGVILDADEEGVPRVGQTLEGTPAFRGGVLPGDRILAVDGVSASGWSVHEIVRRVRGTPGTGVRLTLQRGGEKPFEITLTRAVIEAPTVRARMADPAAGIGYIRISEFKEIGDAFERKVGELERQGLRALVIDLRNNPGGLLDECTDLADRFLTSGVIVRTQGREREQGRTVVAAADDDLPPIPLAILVNDGSASASEVFTGALQDHGRAVVVGTRTYGKGLVQNFFPLRDGSMVKLTVARYFTPKGRTFVRAEDGKSHGLEPDVTLELTHGEWKAVLEGWRQEERGTAPAGIPEADRQLRQAVEILRERLK